MFDVVVDFPKFKVGVATRDECVIEISYLPSSVPILSPKNTLAEKAARQLQRYREDPDAAFDLPVRIEGSALQRGVWDAMCAIPRGRTRTYGELVAHTAGEDRRWAIAALDASSLRQLSFGVAPSHFPGLD